MKPTKEQVLEMIENESEEMVLKEEGEWIQEWKYQYCTSIFYHVPSETYWSYHISRTGSYHSDYEYGDPEIEEVKPVEKTITVIEWKAV